MAHTLVVARSHDPQDPALMKQWERFYAYASIESLRDTPGVYQLAANSWIFDLDVAPTEYAKVMAQAAEHHVPVFSFEVDKKQRSYQIPPDGSLNKILSAGQKA